MPTSVLLAVLAAAGLLALAPALTRADDDAQREAAQRAASMARVLTRRRRHRTVPGPRPIAAPRFTGLFRNPPAYASAVPPPPSPYPAVPDQRPAPRRRERRRWGRLPSVVDRRRRVLIALGLLNLVELAGVLLVGPGFWIGFSVTATIMVCYLVYLRHLAAATARRRRVRQYRAAWLAEEQAAVRVEHERRAARRLAILRQRTAGRGSTAGRGGAVGSGWSGSSRTC